MASTGVSDVVLFGATGFVGRLTAEALALSAPPHARLVLAGRDRSKLQSLRASLPGPERFDIAVADSHDEAALEALAGSSRVVCSAVGPYALHGLPLVLACARNGTHYADLTGEVPFIRDSIDQAHAPAQASGARIVHACGFDSVPSDLGVWMLHDWLREHGLSGHLEAVTFALEAARGGFSGGTLASILNLLDEARGSRERRRLLADPYALSPHRASEPALGKERDQLGLKFDASLKRWTAPFLMAAVNTRVVRRSNALLGHAYGRRFRYREVTAPGGAGRGFASAAAVTAGLAGILAAMSFKPSRSLVMRMLPAPGEGPDAEARQRGFFRIRLHAVSEEGRRLEGLVEGTSDPGYGQTAKMFAEAGLCLAFDEERLPRRAGVLTPASALGRPYLERLERSGMRFGIRTGPL